MAMILLVLVLRCNNSVWQKNISLRLAKDNVFSLIEKSQNNRRIQCDFIKLVSLMTSQMEGSAFMQKSCKKKKLRMKNGSFEHFQLVVASLPPLTHWDAG